MDGIILVIYVNNMVLNSPELHKIKRKFIYYEKDINWLKMES